MLLVSTGPAGHLVMILPITKLHLFFFWLIAWFMVRKNQMHRAMVFVATVFMIAVYIIPHSALGSEIDHTKTEANKTENVIE